MPTYEYECLSCRQHFERKQSFSEEPVRICPACGSEVRRVLHAPGIVFKGSGWYVTDSRKSTDSSDGAASTPAAADGAAASGAAAAGDAKSKPAESGGASGGSSGASASGSGPSGGSGAGGKGGESSPGKSGRGKAS